MSSPAIPKKSPVFFSHHDVERRPAEKEKEARKANIYRPEKLADDRNGHPVNDSVAFFEANCGT
jgi:hypothetical protein